MKYIACLEDPQGVKWVYEGHVGEHPMFVEKDNAVPQPLSEENARFFLETYASEGDRKILIQAERFC
jgi:hypothetical protein